jgi:hypothetical protein
VGQSGSGGACVVAEVVWRGSTAAGGEVAGGRFRVYVVAAAAAAVAAVAAAVAAAVNRNALEVLSLSESECTMDMDNARAGRAGLLDSRTPGPTCFAPGV